MRLHRSIPAAAAWLVAATLLAGPAAAQFVNLPQNDFTWRWGDLEERQQMHDFSASGNEAGFRCDLRGVLRAGTRVTRMDMRRFENELELSLYFIQSAARVMNDLDFNRELAWAVLDCVRPEEVEPDEAKQQERLDRLRERALRRQAERREREERQQSE